MKNAPLYFLGGTAVNSDIENVRQYYDLTVEDEWERLNKHKAEFEITKSYLDRFIRPGDTVLDVGGGPGRYSLYLAAKGCDVTLYDLSPANVAFALNKAESMGLNITGICGDARHADRHINKTFDHVLIMGPLYHLTSETDRATAVNACLNLLKDGGLMYASFISSFAGVIYYLKHGVDVTTLPPEEIEYMYDAASGKDYSGMAFTKAYFANAENIVPFFDSFGLKKECFFGQEGIISPCEEQVNSLPEPAFKEWIEISKRACENPKFINYSEHFMYIGRKVSNECTT